jgi:hypothetical protein
MDRRSRCPGDAPPVSDAATLSRFATLHHDGRRLIHGWYERGREERRSGNDAFEPFIYLWIAFNGWAACVTGEDHDPAWVRTLSSDARLRADYDRLLPSEMFGRAAREFATLWPIFRVDELRRLGLNQWRDPTEVREVMIAEFIRGGARQYEPACWAEHGEGRATPVDWPHTLAALYRVRCNLFHGEKSRSSENDRLVVTLAFDVLEGFVTQGRYLK